MCQTTLKHSPAQPFTSIFILVLGILQYIVRKPCCPLFLSHQAAFSVCKCVSILSPSGPHPFTKTQIQISCVLLFHIPPRFIYTEMKRKIVYMSYIAVSMDGKRDHEIIPEGDIVLHSSHCLITRHHNLLRVSFKLSKHEICL